VKVSFGSNNLLASSSFEQRSQYIKNYPPGIEHYRKIDFWYGEGNYGKINTQGDTIYPNQAHLKQIPGTPDVFVVDFVADAYASFVNALHAETAEGNFPVSDTSPYQKVFVPLQGWMSVNADYGNHINRFYNTNVVPYLMTPAVSKDIVDFDDFIDAFTRLIERVTLLIPFTKTGFVKSKYSSPLVSGLVIECGDYDHGNDYVKISRFINDRNFEVFRAVAKQNGFALDKNAPWRLVAVPGSPAMAPHLAANDIGGVDDLFAKRYYRTHLLDIPTMKSYLFQYYRSFVRDYPKVRIPVVRTIKSKSFSLTKEIPRAIMEWAEYEERYDNLFWIRLCVYIRAKETNQDWDQYKFDHVVQRASDFLTHSTETAAFKYINQEMRIAVPDPSVKTRRGNFRFQRKQRYREYDE